VRKWSRVANLSSSMLCWWAISTYKHRFTDDPGYPRLSDIRAVRCV